jgi:hypothetical protein
MTRRICILGALVAALALPAPAAAYLPTLTFPEARKAIERNLEENDKAEWQLQGCRRINRLAISCREEDWFARETDPGWYAIVRDTCEVTRRNRLRTTRHVIRINTE